MNRSEKTETVASLNATFNEAAVVVVLLGNEGVDDLHIVGVAVLRQRELCGHCRSRAARELADDPAHRLCCVSHDFSLLHSFEWQTVHRNHGSPNGPQCVNFHLWPSAAHASRRGLMLGQ